MTSGFDTIDTLAADLEPVRPLRSRSGLAATLFAVAISATGVFAVFGFRSDILAFAPEPIVVIRAGLLFLLGLATTLATVQAARPSVGRGGNGWPWALGAALVLPLAAILLFGVHLVTGEPFQTGALDFSYGLNCLGISGTSALVIGGVLTSWLRRGAPTDVARAGWLVGLSAGSFGTFAYSLHCPSNSIYYIGLLYSMAVGLCAIAGRLIVSRIVRW